MYCIQYDTIRHDTTVIVQRELKSWRIGQFSPAHVTTKLKYNNKLKENAQMKVAYFLDQRV